eukprot:jgi/Tetstr1/445807/TSEL_033448.t1
MRNEHLRCLVGEYAPVSGHAAVRAISEVASMYLQVRSHAHVAKRRLFASARLVASVKKQGEGGPPDVRLVAVGEAERRAAERAVVDNMKHEYVLVLAPFQLGARDSVLIHDVRLIAKELLGPRAVIVHTDLRNDYSEAWRRGTFMQCHIDCSPLQHVIPALLASLSTDSFLLVDDRSAPLRSEDGVQLGPPLATTSFRVAIHPEVEKCDKTSEVTDGAGRFNVDGEYLVGMPEHVWPALHAFRKSIEASVGLNVCFNKMHAYNGDMKAARREVEAFTEAVDAAVVLTAVERVLIRVSFDPSTYGTDTNPAVTDFLAELLHDPSPTAAKAATLSEDSVAKARIMRHLPTRLKGASVRRMPTPRSFAVRDAAFIGCINDISSRAS